jgi:hypothetical protein
MSNFSKAMEDLSLFKGRGPDKGPRKVRYRHPTGIGGAWYGTVLGPSHKEGHVRVKVGSPTASGTRYRVEHLPEKHLTDV